MMYMFRGFQLTSFKHCEAVWRLQYRDKVDKFFLSQSISNFFYIPPPFDSKDIVFFVWDEDSFFLCEMKNLDCEFTCTESTER